MAALKLIQARSRVQNSVHQSWGIASSLRPACPCLFLAWALPSSPAALLDPSQLSLPRETSATSSFQASLGSPALAGVS